MRVRFVHGSNAETVDVKILPRIGEAIDFDFADRERFRVGDVYHDLNVIASELASTDPEYTVYLR